MKKFLPIIGVLALVVIGFGYYTIFSTPAYENIKTVEESQKELAVEMEDNDLPDVPLSGADTLKNIAAFGRNLECSVFYRSDEYDTTIEGTFFVVRGDIRGDFILPSPDLNGQMVSSMIIKDSIYYVWSDIEGEKYGAKMSLDEFESEESAGREAVSMDESVNYDCKVWENVDNTIFIPPEDVLFYDMNEMFQSGMEYGTIYEEGDF